MNEKIEMENKTIERIMDDCETAGFVAGYNRAKEEDENNNKKANPILVIALAVGFWKIGKFIFEFVKGFFEKKNEVEKDPDVTVEVMDEE